MDARTNEEAPSVGIYTEAQFAAINSAVTRAAATTHPDIQERRPDGLTVRDRSLLISFANSYRLLRVEGVGPGAVMSSRAEKQLRRVVMLCNELNASLRRIKNVDLAEALEDGTIRYIDVVERWAKKIVEGNRVRHETMRKWLKRPDVPKAWLTPRAQYYSAILCLWVSMGGDLKFSRNRKTKRLQGPLIEFLEAAANPALRAEALANTSLQSMIEFVRDGLASGLLRSRH